MVQKLSKVFLTLLQIYRQGNLSVPVSSAHPESAAHSHSLNAEMSMTTTQERQSLRESRPGITG